jgi:hypothetical protein
MGPPKLEVSSERLQWRPKTGGGDWVCLLSFCVQDARVALPQALLLVKSFAIHIICPRCNYMRRMRDEQIIVKNAMRSQSLYIRICLPSASLNIILLLEYKVKIRSRGERTLRMESESVLQKIDECLLMYWQFTNSINNLSTSGEGSFLMLHVTTQSSISSSLSAS